MNNKYRLKVNTVLEIRNELGELYKLSNSIGAIDCAVFIQEADKVLSEDGEYRMIGGDVRFSKEWDYFTKVQSLIDDILYLRDDIKIILHENHKAYMNVDNKLKKAIGILISDEFIQEID